jgi:hypothetical protein
MATRRCLLQDADSRLDEARRRTPVCPRGLGEGGHQRGQLLVGDRLDGIHDCL